MKKLLFIATMAWAINAQSLGLWDLIWPSNTFNKPNFDKVTDAEQRKNAFFTYLLPLVEKENNKIRLTRSLIQNNQLSDAQRQELAKKYRIQTISKNALLEAIDTIPPSLVLAQAAIESNWGRSRFSKHYNNYFGLWCFKPGCGVVPRERVVDAEHEVMIFPSGNKSIEYYLLNLNRNHAYKLLRQIRAYKRKHKLKLTGSSLAEGLDKYSAIGQKYIELVQSIIRQNNLSRFDQSPL